MRFRAVGAYLRTDRRHTVQLARVPPAPQTKWTFTMRTEQKVAVITGASQGIGADALAYAQEMSNPPQTLSGIEDSVVGLPARMLDRDARSYALIARVFASQPEGLRDDILENVTLYWLTNTADSSAPLFFGSKLGPFFPQRGRLTHPLEA